MSEPRATRFSSILRPVNVVADQTANNLCFRARYPIAPTGFNQSCSRVRITRALLNLSGGISRLDGVRF